MLMTVGDEANDQFHQEIDGDPIAGLLDLIIDGLDDSSMLWLRIFLKTQNFKLLSKFCVNGSCEYSPEKVAQLV